MLKIGSFLKNHILGVALASICAYVCYANYTPGTFLTGWDTLHPEFNYRIYLSRILDGVWQEHQSLGAVATQAHASELSRVLVLLLLDIFLPTHMVRYAYTFLMIILGPFGVYAFIKYGVLRDRKQQVGELAGFAGGLFYLFNLCTLQQFYVPLEMFLTHFGLLGWLFLTVVWFLRKGSKKALIWFSMVTLFMAPQAHTATLFYAFFLYLVVYLLTYFVVHKFNRQILKRTVLVITGTLVINLFWFLPNVYFAVTHGKEIQESKIHLLFSQEAFLQNKEYGNIKNAAMLKSFLFNWGEYVGNNRYGDLLDEWKYHLQQPLVLPLGYTFFGLAVVGLVLALVKREKSLIGVVLMLLIGLFFIFNVNPPLGGAFVWLQDNVPLFKEAFRFPFTKFSIGVAFCYAVLFGYFVATTIDKLFGGLPSAERVPVPLARDARLVGRADRPLKYAFVAVFLFLSFYYYAKPMFTGGLISPSMRVAIPQRYFDMFAYFDGQKDYGRVLNLPIHSMWGWVYHNWDPKTTLGYQGAGFLWFGIKQPLINREFDRWNLINEKPYMEISTAIYAQDLPTLEKLLDKYKIRWLLLDQSIVAPAEDQQQLFYPQIQALLASSQKIKLEKDFGQGLTVYRYFPAKDLVLKETLDTYYIAGDDTFKESTDPMYLSYGNYAGNGAKVYPFVGITGYDESVKPGYMSSDDKYLYFNNKLAFSGLSVDFALARFQYKVRLEQTGEAYQLVFTPVEESLGLGFAHQLESVAKSAINPSAISINDSVFTFLPGELGTVLLNPSHNVTVQLYTQGENLLTSEVLFDSLETCSQVGEQTSYSLEKSAGGFILSAQNVDACVTLGLGNYLVEGIGSGVTNSAPKTGIYLVAVGAESPKNQAGHEVCILESTTGLCANSPLVAGRTYFKVVPEVAYNLRFFARGKKALTREVGVSYSDVGLFKLTSLQATSFKPEVSYPADLVSTGWRFEKDLNYFGNVMRLVNFPRSCDSKNTLSVKSQASVIGSFGTPFIRYDSQGESLCDSFEFPSFSHATGAVLEVRSRNLQGMPLRVCLTNEYSKRCDVYVSLAQASRPDMSNNVRNAQNGRNKSAEAGKSAGQSSPQFVTQYFLVPPMGEGRAYTVNISNLTFGGSVSVNDLEYLALTPFPYDFIKTLHKERDLGKLGSLVVYNQAFDRGFVAFCGLLPCPAEHVVVNNWANGWVFGGLADANSVVILFWPQLLEYLGFLALAFWILFGFGFHTKTHLS